MTKRIPSSRSLRLTYCYKSVRMILAELNESIPGSCTLALEGQGRSQSFSCLMKMHYRETITRWSKGIDELVILPKHVDSFKIILRS